MERSKRLGEEKISKLLLQFSIPAIIGMLVNALYNVMDRVFIGNSVGSLGIAGATVGFPISIIMMAFGMLIGMGATSLVSIKLGEQKKDEAELIIGNALVLLVLISLIISVFGIIFINPLLVTFGASEAVLPFARDFMTIILAGAVFMSISFGMNNFIRAEGNPKIAMYTMLIGAILNMILNPIFIFILGLGIKGSALATVISQMVSTVWVISYFRSGKSVLKIHIKNFKIQGEIVKKIITIGMAPFLMQFAASFIVVIMNKSLMHYGGDVEIAAVGIINTVSMLALMPVIGINQGAQPIIGYNYGAEKYDRVRKTLKIAIIAATIVVTGAYFLGMIFARPIISLFNRTDMELINFGSYAMRIFILFLPVLGAQVIGANYFQAVGKPKQAMILTLSRQVLFLIPLLFILPQFFGLNGVLYSAPISDICASVITIIWLLRELRHLGEKHEATKMQDPLPDLGQF